MKGIEPIGPPTRSAYQRWTMLGTVAGALFGLLSGWYVGEPMTSVKWMGDLFLNALRFVVVPLVLTAIVVGVSSLGDVRKLGRFGFLTIAYFVVTSACAAALGITLVLFLQPGSGFSANAADASRILDKAGYGFRDFVLSFLGGGPEFRANVFYSLTHVEMLPVVVFSIVFGAAVTTVGPSGQVVVSFFRGLYDVIMALVRGIVAFTPFGVFALVASKIGALGGGAAVVDELAKVGAYTLTVLLGLAIHAFIILPAVLYFVGRRSPLTYVRGMAEALLTAFATASSAATLPLTTRNVIANNGVSERTATFILPVGATLNMDGTTLYEGVAVIFIAQALGVPLTFADVFVVFVLSTLAAMAAAAIPEAGLVTMVMILQALNLPLEGIGLLLSVDWFLDRCRTMVNVWGDSVGAAALDRLHRTTSSVRLEAV